MYIVFDIGGTKTRVACSNDLKEIVGDPLVFETPHTPKEGLSLIIEAGKTLAGEKPIKAFAGGIAGTLNKEKAGMRKTRNISPEWVGKPLANIFSEIYGDADALFLLENDSALVGLGEMHYGAGTTEGIGVYLTISTGVGGARFVDGYIDSHTIGFEPGHQVIDVDGTLCAECKPCETCNVVDLESMISGSGLERRIGKKPYTVPQEDPLWETLGEWLAYGLLNTTFFWSPEKIVLGGSMMAGDPRISLEKTSATFSELLGPYPAPPTLVLSSLGDFGGLYGGMVYLRQILQKK